VDIDGCGTRSIAYKGGRRSESVTAGYGNRRRKERIGEEKMGKKLLASILLLLMIGVGTIFAEAISMEAYIAASSAPVNRSNAQELLWLVNTLLEKLGIDYVRVTSGARSWGGDGLHPESRAIDLGWDSVLYEKIKRNIAGSGLRLELIEGIRQKGQTDRIHFDIGRNDSDTRGGRTFMP
jgi:hypothetical protein